MNHRLAPAALAAGIAFSPAAFAHGVAGARLFISTLLVDDPNVADEASLPTFFWLPQPADPGTPAPQLYQVNVELDKRITENFGVSLGGGYSWLRMPGTKTANGWQNFEVGLKYKVYVNDEHEFMASVGVVREFGRSGANGSNGAVLGNADVGVTTPMIYFGKGMGDLPIAALRPLAITGTFGYQIPDKKLGTVVDDTGAAILNNGEPRMWVGGLTLQYSMRYLASQVKDFGLPEWVNRLTPVVEMTWSSAASKPNMSPTQYLFGVGVAYTAADYAVTGELLIPGNRNTGSHVGFVAQLHLYFDDLFPRGLGRPIVSW